MAAGDSEGTFGGNGSVYWKVDVNNTKSVKTTDKGNKSWKQEGHNGTATDARFTITLQAPQDSTERAMLASALQQAGADINADRDAQFEMPVEKGKHEQISVRWPSAPEDFIPTGV